MNFILLGGLIIIASAIGAIAVPFATYATTLATFGIAHVAIELRYIDSRFHQHLDRTLEGRLVILLMAIACWRYYAVFGWLAADIAHILELSCGLGLVLLTTQYLGGSDRQLIIPGIILSSLLGIGIVYNPIATSVILAIVHNLTPIGFILDRQESKYSRILSFLCGIIFGAIPLLIFSWQLIYSIEHVDLVTNSVYLNAFVTPAWQKLSIAYPLFSAVVFLQCMHYLVVISLFSQWTSDRVPTLLHWVTNKPFYLILSGISICLLVAFQHNFILTRSLYGIVASIHAWLEIPLLLLLTQKFVQQHTAHVGAKVGTKG
jgi:hypothetical protein